jgi:Protein of unknown function (DUF4013)
VDIGKAITYIFEDDKWVTKLIIGSVLTLFAWLIIPALFVTGYMVRIISNVMAGEPHPLPEWDDWGGLLRDGFNLTVSYLIYSAPLWLLSCCGISVFAPAAFTEGDVSELMAVTAGGTSLIVFCLVALLAVIILLLGPAIAVKYTRDRSIGATLQFGEVISMTREHLGDVVIIFLVVLGLGLVVGVIAAIPLIGWLISLLAGAFITFVTGHLYGQIGDKMVGGPKEKPFDATM